MRPDSGRSGSVGLQLGTGSAECAAYHIPDDDPIDALPAGDDLGAQARMDTRLGVVTRIRARVRTDAPDDEFVRVRRPLENGGVVTIEAALQFDYRRSAVFETDGVIVAVGLAGGLPAIDEPRVPHVVENAPDELAFVLHRGGKLSADALDGTPEHAATVEFVFVQAVIAKRMRLGLQGLGERPDPPLEPVVLPAGDDAHAASRVPVACRTTGSMIASARKRTTGTTTPSPVR